MFVGRNPGKKVISLMVVLLICVSILSVVPVLTVSAATTAVITNTNPMVKSCIQANNVIPNADLENGTDFWSGWYGYGWGSPWPGITSSDSHSASNSLLLGAGSWNPSGNSAVVAIEANTEYTFSFWYKGVDNGGAQFVYQLHFPDYANRISDGDYLTPDSQWRQAAVTFNSGNATSFSMLLWMHDSDTNSHLFVDDMCLFKTYKPVITTTNPAVKSTTQENNLIPNSNFENGTDFWSGWFGYGWGYPWANATTTDSHSSNNSLKLGADSWSPSGNSAPVSILPNTDYTFSMWYKGVNNGGASFIYKYCFPDASNIIGGDNYFNLDGQWHQAAVSFNSKDTNAFSLLCWLNATDNSSYLLLDDMCLFETPPYVAPQMINTTLKNVTSTAQNNVFPDYNSAYWATAFNGANIHTEISTADTHSTSGKSVKYTNWSWNPNSFTAVNIEPNTDYTFSVWTKSVDDGSNSLSALLAFAGSTLIQDAGSGISWYMTRLDGLWHQYAVSFNSGHETTFSITLTGDYMGGTNYCELDDFYLFKNSDGLPPIVFNTYNVSNDEAKTVTNVQPSTTVANFTATGKTTVATNGATIEIKNLPGTTLGQLDKIGTGTTVDVYVCELKVDTYTIIIYGDVNGDGLIALDDLATLKQHLLKQITLTGISSSAGDISANGNISINDLLAVKKGILGITSINQNR